MNDIEDPIVYPENPPWTMFFDGPLYEKYKDFMMTKDFSQILLKNKLKIAHQSSTVPEVPDAVDGIDWWSVDQDVTGKSEKQFASDTYNSVSDDFYRKFTRGKREEKRRTRRTRAIILLIILVLLGVSLGTALIIHYFFVPTDENQVPAQVNISFSGNTSIFGMTTDKMKVEEDIPDKTSSIHDLLNTFEADKTIAVPDKPRKEDLGAILLQTNQPPLVEIVRVSSTASTTSTSSSTTSSTSASTSPSRTKTVSTESTTPELPIDTGTFNAMDFFGMDDSFTTSELPIKVPVTTVKVFKTKTPIKPTLSTETLSLTTTEAVKTTSVTSTETVSSVLQETTTAVGTPKPPKTTSSMSTATATKVQNITESFTTNEPTTERVQEVMSTPQHSITNPTTQTMTMTPVLSTKSELPATTSTMPSNTTTSTPATPMVTTTTADPPLQTILETSTAAASTTTTQAATTQTTTKMTSQTTTTTTQATTTTTTTQAATTTIPETTTEVTPQINLNGSTTYKSEMATVTCTVTDLGRVKSMSISELKDWEPVTVTLYENGSIFWSYTRTERHDAAYEYKNITGSDLKQLTFTFFIKNVECQDSGTFKCVVNTESHEVSETTRLFVVGRPDDKIELEIGPAIIEDRALRITAIWQAGYPIPWTNMSWTALDADNQTYNLADYGEYRDYELKEDHFQCRTFLETSIVIFPKVHLNDTTVIIKPNLVTTRFFLEEPMIEYLKTVKYAVEKILVIPLNYCQNGSKEMSIPHPYTTCEKFVWCLPGDLVVQQCPIGTCFIEKLQECL